MLQFPKSELLWQLVGGFALGTIAMLIFGPSESTRAVLRHIGAAIGL